MSEIKLHLGCGKRDFGPDWVHIDGGDFSHVVSHDVTKLPFYDGKVSLIYASHLLEYFDWDDAKTILKEWYRVLRPGGLLQVAVPDFAVLANLYTNGLDYKGFDPVSVSFKGFNKSYDLWQLRSRLEVPLERIVGPLFGRMEMGGQLVYHKTTYDYSTLVAMLRTAGFGNVCRFDVTKTDHGTIDDHSHARFPSSDPRSQVQISLNMQGQKP